MKKIMLIVPSFTKGGVERVVNTLSKGLKKYEDVELLKDAMERMYHDRELYMKLK